MAFEITQKGLTLGDITRVAADLGGVNPIEISKELLKKIRESRKTVEHAIESGGTFYGINTGFGALASIRIPNQDLIRLQENLIRSHCTGVGNPLSPEESRAILFLRLNCLALGKSGVSEPVIERLLFLLNQGVTPVIPEKGSVGASGDLAPLAHVALTLLGEGEVFYQGERLLTKKIYERLKLKPVALSPKDGLCLINGTQMMTALGVIYLMRSKNLLDHADLVAAMSIEACRGTRRAFDPRIHEVRPHPGQMASASNIRRILSEGSGIGESHIGCGKVQDPYSLRCSPQVHGAVRTAIHHVKEILEIEINSVTDNPLIFNEKNGEFLVLSGGNFHGEPIAKAIDYAKLSLSELSSISERRIDKLINSQFSELPSFLVRESGVNSGLMIAHVTAAALASENKGLSHPSSCDSIPTSAEKEDHVSMGPISARQFREVVFNVTHVLALEFLAAYQGLNLLKPLKPSYPIQKVVACLKKEVRSIDEDRNFSPDIQKIVEMIESRILVHSVESEVGPLLSI